MVLVPCNHAMEASLTCLLRASANSAATCSHTEKRRIKRRCNRLWALGGGRGRGLLPLKCWGRAVHAALQHEKVAQHSQMIPISPLTAVHRKHVSEPAAAVSLDTLTLSIAAWEHSFAAWYVQEGVHLCIESPALGPCSSHRRCRGCWSARDPASCST